MYKTICYSNKSYAYLLQAVCKDEVDMLFLIEQEYAYFRREHDGQRHSGELGRGPEQGPNH